MRPPSVPFPGDTQGGAGSSSGQGLPPGKSAVYLSGKSACPPHMLDICSLPEAALIWMCSKSAGVCLCVMCAIVCFLGLLIWCRHVATWPRLSHPLSPSVFALTMAALLRECGRTGCVAVCTPACEDCALPFVLCFDGLILLV